MVRPELKAGDLLIWNGLVAHGVAPNTSADGVRSVQYLTMMPALPTHENAGPVPDQVVARADDAGVERDAGRRPVPARVGAVRRE